ncbi:aldo/keto reductase [Candidatus Saccharibacteria bacterium]|nr:aldo/keto reductase [Candidatus Saccharibacteria bacterium]
MDQVPSLRLNTRGEIPVIGFGTWQLSPEDAYSSVIEALEVGYRLIDTAKIYGNEEAVGEAVRNSKIPRQEIFLTTKLWNSDHGYDSALKAFDASLKRLGQDYVDLYLIHWPGDDRQRRADSWTALRDLYKEGRSKAIGVSNYTVRHLQELLDSTDTPPAVNQIEFHPFIYHEQKELLDFCEAEGIIFEAYSPLARGRRSDPLLEERGAKYGKSTSQVMLRWALQHGTVPLPRSADEGHIRENFEVFDFELSSVDMEAIDKINQTDRTAWNPTNLP